MAAYTPTLWVNYASPDLTAANLNKLTNELKLQAGPPPSGKNIAHTLPVWVDGASPALTDPTALNEMERVTRAVALSVSLSYTQTVWQAGWSPGRNAANLNKLEQAAFANRNAIDALPVGQGTLFDRLTSFGGGWASSLDQGAAAGQTDNLQNRWRPTNTDGNPDYHWSPPSYVGIPYASAGVPAIQEIATPYGGGFKILCNPEMTQPDGGKPVFICDSNQSPHNVFNGGLGSTEDWSGKFHLPSSGNPNGFPTGSNVGTLWEFHTGDSSGNGLGMEPWTSTPTRRFRSLVQTGPGQTYISEYGALVSLDVWHSFRIQIKWASDASGFMRTWFDGNPVSNHTGPTIFGGQRPWLQFGFYANADPGYNNEIWYADIRKA